MASVIACVAGRHCSRVGALVNQSSKRSLSAWVKDVTVNVTFINHEVRMGYCGQYVRAS